MTRLPPQALGALLNQGVTAHRAGNLDAAEATYDKILKADKTNADALNLKGLILAARGDQAGALELFDRAAKAAPPMADVHANRGNALAALGRGDEALKAYREAVRLKPGHLEAWLNTGTLFHRAGRLDDAVATLRAAAKACPDFRVFYNLAQCLRDLPAPGDEARKAQLEEALAALERAVALNAGFAPAHIARGAAFASLGVYDQAIRALESAIALVPGGGRDKCELLNNLGDLFRKNDQLDRAIPTLREALALEPADTTVRYNLALSLAAARETGEAEVIYRQLIADAPDLLKPYVNLGNLLRDQNRSNDAIALFEQALARDPALAEAYTNIGACLADRGWLFAAVLQHHKALSLKPGDPETSLNFAVNLLRLGRFAEGWPPYEQRFGLAGQAQRRPVPPRYWQGEDIRDKTVLVWTEQGIGDEILYASMIPDLIGRAGACRIECSTRLLPAFTRSFPGIPVTAWENPDQPVNAAAGIDFQIAAGSLGCYLRPSFDSFPRSKGYLKPDPALAARIRAAYEAQAGGRKIIGISWRSGNAKLGPDKTARLLNLAPILRVPGCFFVNLQYGDCGAEISELRAATGAEIFQDPAVNHVTDIEAALAQAAAMDLVITTSNTAAHLAAAQGVPTWIMLPSAKGVLWYWFTRRDDSPWYSSARLFRAEAAEAWDAGVAGRVAGALADQVASASQKWSDIP